MGPRPVVWKMWAVQSSKPSICYTSFDLLTTDSEKRYVCILNMQIMYYDLARFVAIRTRDWIPALYFISHEDTMICTSFIVWFSFVTILRFTFLNSVTFCVVKNRATWRPPLRPTMMLHWISFFLVLNLSNAAIREPWVENLNAFMDKDDCNKIIEAAEAVGFPNSCEYMTWKGWMHSCVPCDFPLASHRQSSPLLTPFVFSLQPTVSTTMILGVQFRGLLMLS